MLNLISSKIHGILDYLFGILLIVLPTILGFDRGISEWVMIILGITTIVYSLITNYELSLARLISLRIHLGLDYLFGVVLLFSPWLLGFSDRVYLPHVIMGIIELAVVHLSNPAPRAPLPR
jgi:hypothetical protein